MGAVSELLRRGCHAISTVLYNVINVNAPVTAQRAAARTDQERVRAVTLCQPMRLLFDTHTHG